MKVPRKQHQGGPWKKSLRSQKSSRAEGGNGARDKQKVGGDLDSHFPSFRGGLRTCDGLD